MKFSGRRLRKIRERERMSQLALAVDIGVSQWLISAYERGTHRPGSQNLRKLCSALKCEEADLLE